VIFQSGGSGRKISIKEHEQCKGHCSEPEGQYYRYILSHSDFLIPINVQGVPLV
jgi:hypothetical protein